MKLITGDKLLMIGDSVTDVGRSFPVGEGGGEAPLGRGYVSYVDGLLKSIYPDLPIRVVNMGTSGHTERNLKARWQTDVLDLKPDWVSIMIGINDVWRQFDRPQMVEEHVYQEEYESTLDELVAITKPRVKGIVLMTPFFIEASKQDAMRLEMDQYGAIVRKTAEKHDALFVDTQQAFDAMTAHMYSAAIAWDRVHPNTAGHMALARAFLNALDFEWRRS